LLLTDLSPLNVAQSATDPDAIRQMSAVLPDCRVIHLPRIHAKVYVQDGETEIVTSGNLTTGGLELNYEYGLKVLDGATATAIRQDIEEYSVLGALVTNDALRAYGETADELRQLYAIQERAVRRGDDRLRRALLAAADKLISLRLARGPMHTVFAATIQYLLTKYGPMPTVELHRRIAAIHPDLCDDSIDRIIDGKSYGKKWKHAVRTAQQQLKKRKIIRLVRNDWKLTHMIDSTREELEGLR
jgi:hypothetical protein